MPNIKKVAVIGTGVIGAGWIIRCLAHNKIVYAFDKDLKLKKNLISEIKPFDIENLIKLKIVQGGMIPKIMNCIDAVEHGVKGVVILDGRKPRSILFEIFSDKGSGTLIRK